MTIDLLLSIAAEVLAEWVCAIPMKIRQSASNDEMPKAMIFFIFKHLTSWSFFEPDLQNTQI
jgi:hypothetical protein